MMDVAEQVGTLQAYLRSVRLGPTHGELALDRESLLAQLSNPAVAGDTTRWEAAKAFFDWFQDRYHQAYQDHHRRHHLRLREMQETGEEIEHRLSALAHLNQLTELGRAVGAGIFATWDRLSARMRPCSLEALPKDEPICPQCHLQLATNPPREELVALRERVSRALLTQQRRLSQEVVSRVLAQPHEPQLDRLLRAARAADLADLVSLIDEEMVAFLRQFLSPEPAYAAPATTGRPLRDPPPAPEATLSGAQLLAALRQRFPTIEEAQVEAVGQEVARLLREALAQARPGRGEKARLRLE